MVSSAKLPGSEDAETCLEVACGGDIPKYGREYDLRNVESRGNEDNEGSLDNLRNVDESPGESQLDSLTSSLITFIIHSPPLLSGASRMIPTRANSAETRKTGRWRVIREESSFSRCSGDKVESVARGGAANAD